MPAAPGLPPGLVLEEPPTPAQPEGTATELFAKASPAVVRVVVRDQDFKIISQGSGLFVTGDGLLATNCHVIEGAAFATVLLPGSEPLSVEGVAGVDAEADVALLKVKGKDFPHLPLDPGPLPTVGTRVYAIGNPEGLTNTLSEGLVSGLRQVKDGLSIIQTTAAISPGSSGGPLLTADGKAVGVTKSFLAEGQNLNFAVPALQVRRLLGAQTPLRPLASVGGKRLNRQATDELDKAWTAINRSDWRSATDILTKLRKMEPDNPFVWVALGYLHGKLGNDEIAIQHYRNAITLKPDFAGAYWGMGGAYHAMGKYTEAIGALKQTIALRPDFAEAYFVLGTAYDGLQKYTEAIGAYKQAITIKPDYAEPSYCMGMAYERLGQRAAAITAYREALRLQPAGELANDALAGIRRLGDQRPEAARADEQEWNDFLRDMGKKYGAQHQAAAIAAARQYFADKCGYTRANPPPHEAALAQIELEWKRLAGAGPVAPAQP